MTLKRIKSVRFGILGPTEIRKMSVSEIITPDTYDEDGFPIDLGLMSQKLGVIDPGLRCKTCGGRMVECPGHFGHIELAYPVIHIGFVKKIHKVLSATCRSCGRVMLDESERMRFIEEFDKIKRTGGDIEDFENVVKDVFRAAAKSECPFCGERQLRIRFEKPASYYEVDEEGGERRLMPTDVRARLERIPDEDVRLLGMDPENARPEWMVLTVLPVPPVTARPSITLETGQRSEDDLTHKLVDILRINQRLIQNKDAGAPQLIIEDLWELLQYHVATFLDNEIPGVPPARHRSGRPLKGIAQRLKGKEGRFRGSLSGKRVNFSARTVISPDPNISIDEVGVPETIAKELTVTVYVTPRNIEDMRETVRRGPRHPGANYVRRPDGRKLKVTEKNCESLAAELDVGWRVERHLRDGDIVLFNRQPSLHRLSIMAHYVRVMPGRTFRLNPAVCPPYNADFDGDEMNLHVLQTEEARGEAKILMEVQANIISPRFGRPIIGGLHDHITGMFILTRGFKRFSRDEVLRILRGIEISEIPPPAGYDESGKPFWTGKQIFSVILPPDLNANFRAKFCDKCYERGEACKEDKCDRDSYVIIRNGELLRGVIDDKALGSFKGALIERIYKKYGPSAAKEFINKFTKLAINIITQYGFSYGINDSDLPKEAKDYITEEVLREAIERVKSLQEAYEMGELEPLPGRTEEETLELLVMQELGSARDGAGEVASRYLDIENPAVLMAKSGARGSMLNLTQMSACVGQQSIRGERIKRGYQNRTLPHFRQGDLSAEAHGFVKSSFKDGLTPIEYFFHAAGGREALVDTAVRTSQSGYFQRRLINALQDLSVRYDGTVREARGIIVQFNYGDDGVDPSKSYYERYIDEIVEEVLANHESSDESQVMRESEAEAEAGVEVEAADAQEMMRW
ncbi:MAG: DNA-directed RNA polymerase subunit A' [Canidatus Methanoxibalbensis ujae]|nr:DNA-directed RNA polymerase subunit A' [Candidatus Methanoxibalbensis ujae]